MIQDLKNRNLLYQCTDEKGLQNRMKKKPITLYAGFDPTADSFHVGNLVIILTLKRFQLAGHRVLALVGGGTGLIGDPSGRPDERTLNSNATVEEWSQRLRNQLERFLDFEGENPAKIVNNYDWLSSVDAIGFLRTMGKHLPLNYMLAKDSVSSRLENGISYTEFSYMALQAYDFTKLSELYDCELQIGGSDQWGNITAGTELYRRLDNNGQLFGMSIPLLTKKDGSKFGKSQGGNIWLDADKTTVDDFYQFWLNTEDHDAEKLLNVFTFLPVEEIKNLSLKPDKAKRVLADEVTNLVHGGELCSRCHVVVD